MKVVVCSEVQWLYVRTRKQQLVSRFPADWPVLFLQAFVRGRRNDWRPKRDGRVTYVTVPVFKSIPNPVLRRLLDLGVVRAAVNGMLAVWVWWIRVVTGFGGRDVVLYVSNIFYGRILGSMRRRAAIYDCNDNHLAFPGTPGWARGYLGQVVRQVDAVVVSAPLLREEVDPFRPRRVVEIGNGVDFALFDAAFTSPRHPREIAELPRPRIGYAGALAEWIDLDLMAEVARAFPTGTLVLVGPAVGPRVRPTEFFAGIPNVVWLGSKPHEDLPHWVAEMDVCLIPFRLNDLTRGVNPNKLYEYLAVGKPVVATDFSPFIHGFGDLVRVGATAEEFVRQIESALAGAPQVEARRACAREHGWDASAAALVQLLEEIASPG
jgi:glycosyltransferase involved in cell wall biosynthesis